MSPEDLTLITLLGPPLLAAISLGFLARAFVDGGGGVWPLWLVLLAASLAIWVYFIRAVTP